MSTIKEFSVSQNYQFCFLYLTFLNCYSIRPVRALSKHKMTPLNGTQNSFLDSVFKPNLLPIKRKNTHNVFKINTRSNLCSFKFTKFQSMTQLRFSRTCAYQEVRNVCFSEILACFAFLKPPF